MESICPDFSSQTFSQENEITAEVAETSDTVTSDTVAAGTKTQSQTHSFNFLWLFIGSS